MNARTHERPGASPPPRPSRARLAAAGAAVVLLSLATGACALFFRSPTVAIADVRVSSVGIAGATAELSLEVINPNRYNLTAREVRYRLSFQDEEAEEGWRTLAQGENDEVLMIGARDTSLVRLSVPFTYADLGRAVGNLLTVGELAYRVDGDVKFDAPLRDIRVPFDRRGSLTP